jgi:pimeloyl-ACP methyl ester carboxylesterase
MKMNNGTDNTDCDRRRFLGLAAMSLAATEFGFIGSVNAQPSQITPAGATTIKPGTNDLAKGEAKYDDLESKLAEGPVITVPTITLEGDANGAPHPPPDSYAKQFSGKYEHRKLEGIGHNLPQEAPQAFAQAYHQR